MGPKLVTVPELFLIAGTRAALGVGVGLLLADRLSAEQRRALGWTLFAVGAITTVPLVRQVIFQSDALESHKPVQSNPRRRQAVTP